MRQEVLERNAGGMWPWLGQRVTAVLVMVTIMVHLILTHLFASIPLTFDDIGDRLASTAVLVNDVVLLLAVLYHGLNGVRMVALDWGLSGGGRRVLDGVLWLVGIAAAIYGVWALWVWVS
jgi:succinate dehydrogenase hydrophobic anchor subunit